MDLRDLTEEEKTLIAEFRLCSEEERVKILHNLAQQGAQPDSNSKREKQDS